MAERSFWKSISGFFSRLLYEKRFAIPFSILIAVVFWLAITINENPVRESTVNGVSVSIITEDTMVSELGLDIIGEYTNKVDVRVSGPNYIISSLSAKDLTVSASLSGVNAAGTYTIDLYASRNSSKLGYTVVGVEPAQLTLTFDNIDTVTFPVTAVANGASATQGLVAEKAIVTDSEFTNISIKGPRTEMEKIATVLAVADVNQTLEATKSFDAKLQLLDAAGKELDLAPFTLPTENIKISVPISKTKEVPLLATFTNAPDGYALVAIPHTLSEQTVTLIGPPETIDTITNIKLAPIDFTKIDKETTSFEVALNLPTAVKTMETMETVVVKISAGTLTEKTFTVTNFTATNLEAGRNMTVSGGALKRVRICGTSDAMRNLTADSIYANVDLSGKAPGEYTVEAKITVKDRNNVWQVGTYDAVVTIQ